MFHVTFNNHSGWKLLKACRKCIFSEYLYTLHVCKHLFWVWQVFLSLTNFAYAKKEGGKKEVMSSTSNVYIIDENLIWKFNQSSVLLQNNDNFKQLLFCKKTKKTAVFDTGL